jgi:hypothetical protein
MRDRLGFQRSGRAVRRDGERTSAGAWIARLALAQSQTDLPPQVYVANPTTRRKARDMLQRQVHRILPRMRIIDLLLDLARETIGKLRPNMNINKTTPIFWF